MSAKPRSDGFQRPGRRYPDELTESELGRQLTSVEDSPERSAAIGRAIEGLIEAELVVRAGGRVRLTPPAPRAGELELGL